MSKLPENMAMLAQKVAYGHCSKERAKYIIAAESAERKSMFWTEVKLWGELLCGEDGEVANHA